MPDHRDFEIAFVGLKPGVTVFEYTIGDKFFEAEKPTDFDHCKAGVKLLLDKHAGFMQLKFEVGGSSEMQCNRCGNPLEVTLFDDFEIVVKQVDNPTEMNDSNDDPDVYFISRNDSHIDVKQWLTEFVQLSMPTYPACAEEEIGSPQCNKEVLDMLKKLEDNDEHKQNPLWSGLDKFKEK